MNKWIYYYRNIEVVLSVTELTCLTLNVHISHTSVWMLLIAQILTLCVQKFYPLNISNFAILKINRFCVKTASYTWKIYKYNHMKNECTRWKSENQWKMVSPTIAILLRKSLLLASLMITLTSELSLQPGSRLFL